MSNSLHPMIMQILSALPLFFCTLVLFVATLIRLGKEPGAAIGFIGATLLLIENLVRPIVYLGVMPKMIEKLDPQQVSGLYTAVNICIGCLAATAILCLALGVFQRAAGGRAERRDTPQGL